MSRPKKYGLPVVTVEQITDPGERQQKSYFIPGGIAEAAQVVAACRPEKVFPPTVPVHVSAGLISELSGFEPEPAGGADAIAACIPERFVVGRNGADIYGSLNPDQLCNPNCPEPSVCPVTGEQRNQPPLWSLFRNSLSAGVVPGSGIHRTVIIQSRQCGPGLGVYPGFGSLCSHGGCRGGSGYCMDWDCVQVPWCGDGTEKKSLTGKAGTIGIRSGSAGSNTVFYT
ncbi:hypothetical protein [Methanogenium cariaci]|uniref:hypothetical protein n=1 Tax=Methanogenium cariaci TaxID=2197 RepID=UPI000785423E|nr:hypothetical protein [Methanogenium cariaci]